MPQKKPPVQESEQSIDLSSRLVSVFFSVTDKRNAVITDLRQEDLEVYDRHPEHEKARAYIKANRTATATVDFEF